MIIFGVKFKFLEVFEILKNRHFKVLRGCFARINFFRCFTCNFTLMNFFTFLNAWEHLKKIKNLFFSPFYHFSLICVRK